MVREAEKKYQWRTAIADTHSGTQVLIRGYDLLELLENVDFATAFYLVLNGELPTKNQARMINAMLVAVIDHGIAPSSTVARFIASAGVPIQTAVAGGLLTVGDIHAGAGEQYAKMIQGEVVKAKERGISLEERAKEMVMEHRQAKKRIDGYGHPQHPEGDPRAPVLLRLADKLGISGDHVRLARAIEKAIEELSGRRIPMNIDGVLGAIMSDLGFSWRAARTFIMVPRTVGLSAHAIEEMVREPGWRAIPLEEVQYDGQPSRKLPAGYLKRD